MSKKYDLAVFIGRFQPFHRGHQMVIEEALEIANKVAIIIGSSNAPRSTRNPFTYEERVDMINDAFSDDEADRLYFAPVEDTLYNDQLWVKNVQDAVKNIQDQTYGGWAPAAKTTLFGRKKDHTSYYLNLFPQWSNEGISDHAPSVTIPRDATSIREDYFKYYMSSTSYWLKNRRGDWVETIHALPESTINFLEKFAHTDDFNDLVEEYRFIKRYKESWAQAPFPPTFVTVDAVVVQSGHLLLVKRKAKPGQGLWALPGGFLNQEETIQTGIIRELKEETKIKVPEPVLRGSIVDVSVFDAPHRSTRGRTITHAGLISLKAADQLPKVKRSDDAEDARWFPLTDVKRNMMYEDHYDIILNMVAKL
jgi:bifunctional NMN adenylyltransferase/nudix hydrolase